MFDVKRSPDVANERLESAKIQRKNIELERQIEDLLRENTEQRRALGKHVKETIGEAVDAWKIVYKNGHAEKTVNDAFRAGIEGTVSVLKRAFGLWRCLREGFKRFESWVATGVPAHNLVLLARK